MTVDATPLEARAGPTLAAPSRWIEVLTLGVPLVVLAVLSLVNLGGLSLWRDEVASVVFAKGSLGQLLTIVGRDREAVGLANMGAYYLLLHFWLAIGETEARIRLLSVIFGVASVVPVYFIARRLGGWLAAALAAGIFVLIPYVVHYSQEARGYSLAMLIAGGLTWLLLIGLERRGRVWPWLAYGLIAALGLYVHFFLALVVAAHGLWLLATRSLPPWRNALAAGLPIVLAAAPIPFIIAEFGSEQEWIAPLTLPRAVAALSELVGGPWLLGTTTAVLVAGGALLHRRDSRFWLVVASVAVPIAGALAISAVKPIFIPRYLIVVLPALAVGIGVTVAAIRPAIARAALACTLAVLVTMGLPSAYSAGTEIDWRGAGRWLAEEARPGDRIVASTWYGSPLEYYMLRTEPTADVERVSADEAMLPAGDSRLWLVLTDARQAQMRDAVLQFLPRYAVLDSREFGTRTRILLLVPTGDAAPG